MNALLKFTASQTLCSSLEVFCIFHSGAFIKCSLCRSEVHSVFKVSPGPVWTVCKRKIKTVLRRHCHDCSYQMWQTS